MVHQLKTKVSATPEEDGTRPLSTVSELAAAIGHKRHGEMIRFRTCCADPRASK